MSDGPAITEDDLSRIGFEVDMRLTDVWGLIFERGHENIDEDFLAWLLRLAYVTGYWDSLSEPERGALCASLGYPVPGPSAAPRPEAPLDRDADRAPSDERPGVIRASVSRHVFRSV